MHSHVYLACAVRSSVTGDSLCDASLTVTADGLPARVIRKADGYVLFTALSVGEHKITFSHPYYIEEHRTVVIAGEDDSQLDIITMRPTHVYGSHLCRLKVTGLAPNAKTFISGMAFPMQLQQSDCKEGTLDVRLFRKGNFKLIPPLMLLCADEKAPEVCVLMDPFGDDIWRLNQPLQKSHKRGTRFFTTQSYEADGTGCATATFFAAGTVIVLYENKLYEVEVKEGETEWQIPS